MFTQADRPLALRTPLGEDRLLLRRLEGETALGRPFRITLDLLAPRPADIPFDKVLGQTARVRMRMPGGKDRYFHGVIDRLAQTGGDAEFAYFQADLVPPLALLDLTVRSRPFSNLSTPRILKAVLAHPLLRCEFKWIDESIYAPRAFCVQYEESDLAFAQRLMEDEGIFYFFEHGENETKLIVTDSVHLLRKASEVIDAADVVSFDDTGAAPAPRLRTWVKEQRLRAARVGLRDFAYQTTAWTDRRERKLAPQVTVGKATHRLDLNAAGEVREYPGGHAQRFDSSVEGAKDSNALPIDAEGERLVWVRAEAEAAQGLRVWGTGDAGHLEPGYLFGVSSPRGDDRDGVYYATRVKHRARASGFRSGEDAAYEYANDFEALPQALPYRPMRQTPRPRIDGVQTAIVLGLPPEKKPPFSPESIETGGIRVDARGRVRVLFPWDADSRVDEERSCWVRVAQAWAGNQYGAFFWPRPGHEVVVAFENGDPDRPLIVGSVYNERNRPPCHAEPRGHVNGFKSASIGGNPASEYNALVFHDTLGNEHVQVRSYRQSVSTRAVHYEFTSGPMREIVGEIPMPVGSGSGGGLLDLLAVVSVLTPALDPYFNLFRGKCTQVWGNNKNSTLYGQRISRSIGSSDTRMSVDLQQLLAEALENAPDFLGDAIALVTRDLGIAGMRGASDLFFGGRSSQVYHGPSVDIKRCQTFTLKEASFFRGVPSMTTLAAKSTAVLAILSAMALEVLERVFANRDERLLVEAICSTVPDIFHGINLALEKKLAQIQMTDATAYEARTIAHQWADLQATLTTAGANALAVAAMPIVALGLRRTLGSAIQDLQL